MIDLSWGGYANGSPELEAVLIQADGGIPGDLLEVHTAWAWAEWRRRVHADTGVWLQLDHSDSIPPAFRNRHFQEVAWYNSQHGGPTAAVLYTTNHGYGRAFDCTGFENRPDVWASMVKHGAELGLSNATGAASGERWHWESLNPPTATAALGATPLTNGEDDLSAADVAELKSYIDQRVGQSEARNRRETRARVYQRTELNGAPLWIAGPTIVPRAVANDTPQRHDKDILKGDSLLVDAGDFASPQSISEAAWALLVEEHDHFRNAIADAVVAKLKA